MFKTFINEYQRIPVLIRISEKRRKRERERRTYWRDINADKGLQGFQVQDNMAKEKENRRGLRE